MLWELNDLETYKDETSGQWNVYDQTKIGELMLPDYCSEEEVLQRLASTGWLRSSHRLDGATVDASRKGQVLISKDGQPLLWLVVIEDLVKAICLVEQARQSLWSAGSVLPHHQTRLGELQGELGEFLEELYERKWEQEYEKRCERKEKGQ